MDLNQAKPSDLKIERPWEDPLWRVRLLWLLDNEPQNTLRLWKEDRLALRLELLQNVQRGSLLRLQLQQNPNLAEDQVEELVLDCVAPGDCPQYGPNPPRPLPERDYLAVLNWSDGLLLENQAETMS